MRRALSLLVLSLFGTLPAQAATTFYPLEAGGAIGGYRQLSTVRGGGVISATTNTVQGPTSGVQLSRLAGGVLLTWISCPLEAVTLSGNVTVNLWGAEGNAAANAGWDVRLHKYTGGSEQAAFFTSQQPGSACLTTGQGCTEIVAGSAVLATHTAQQWTDTPASTAFVQGDRIVFKVFINDANSAPTYSMQNGTATVRQVLMDYGGVTAAAAGDTWVQFADTLTCVPPVQPVLMGGLSSGTFLNLWTTDGTPTLTYDTGQWWVQINPAASGTEYIEQPIASGTQTYTNHVTVKAVSWPTTGEQLALRNCAGSSCALPQGLLTIGADRKARVYFQNTGDECTSNSIYKHTACTVGTAAFCEIGSPNYGKACTAATQAADCGAGGTCTECPTDIGGNPGEAACAQSVFAQTEALDLAAINHFALVTSADSAGARPHDVTQTLFLNGFNRGSATRYQGTCTGGTGTINPTGKACGATADCTDICTDIGASCSTAGTCTTTTIIGNLTSVQYGAPTSGLAAMDVLIGDDVVTLSATDPYARYTKVVPLWPTGNGTNNWADSGGTTCTSNHWACVDDTSAGGAIDNDGVTSDVGTVLQDSSNADEIWALTDYTPAEGETVVAVTARGDGKETANNANNTGKSLTVGFRDAGTNETLGAAVDLATFGDDSNYRVIAGPVMQVQPGGGALDVNALRGLIRKTGTTGTGFRIRVTNFVAEVAIALPAPNITDYLPDVNGDGRKTVAVVGDSIMNDAALFEALNGLLIEPDDLLDCAAGGQTIGDIEQSWTNVLGGVSTGALPCAAVRGQTDHAPDIVLLHIGANNFFRWTLQGDDDGYCSQRGCVGGSNAGAACTTTAADCPGGTCTDLQGPNHGDPCGLPSGTKDVEPAAAGGSQASIYRKKVCIQGDNVGQCCAGLCAPVVCGGPGGCASGANLNAPCTVATATADCGGGVTCAPWGVLGATDLADADANFTTGWCQLGSASSPDCLKGACLRQTSTAYVAAALRRMLDVAAARTGAQAVTVILLGNTMPYEGTDKACVGGPDHAGGNLTKLETCDGETIRYCNSDSDCDAPGKCKHSKNQWEMGRTSFEWLQRYMRATALRRGLPFVDLGAYIKSVSQAANDHLRDFIHACDEGQQWMADVIGACLHRDTAVEANKCGDLYGGDTFPAREDLPALGTSETVNTPLDRMFCTQVGTPTGALTVDALMISVTDVPTAPLANVQCSLYTASGSTATKVDAGCDTASTSILQAGWHTLGVSGACALSASTLYYQCCNSDHAGLTYTAEDGPLGLVRSSGTESYGLPSPFTLGFSQAQALPWYLRVH